MTLVQLLHVLRSEVRGRHARAIARSTARGVPTDAKDDPNYVVSELERTEATVESAIKLLELEDAKPEILESVLHAVPPWLRTHAWHLARRIVAAKLPTRPPEAPTTRPPV